MSPPAETAAGNRLHWITRPAMTSPPEEKPIMGASEVSHVWWFVLTLLNCQSYLLSSAHSNKPAMSHTAQHHTDGRQVSPWYHNVAFLCVCVCMHECLFSVNLHDEWDKKNKQKKNPWVINKSDCNDGTLGRRCSINRHPHPIPVSSISALPLLIKLYFLSIVLITQAKPISGLQLGLAM